MNQIRWFLSSLVVSSFISLVHSGQEEALAFNPETLELYDLKSMTTVDPNDNRPCAVACPGQQQEEINFFKNISMRHKSLFIQDRISTVYQRINNPITCEQKFELVQLVHKRQDGKFLEFGYEVFYLKSKFVNDKIKTDDPSDFWEAVHEENFTARTSKWLSDHQIRIKKDERKEESKKWGFVWISKIAMRYSIPHWKLKAMRYVIDPLVTTTALSMTCHSRDLDGSILHSASGKLFDNYYDSSQEDIFKGIALPDDSCDRFKHDCVKRYDLLMPHYYLSSDPKSISCSNLTTVSIWNHTLPDELMERIKLFLVAVAKVANRELIVIPGVIDILALPKAGKKNDFRKMYLKPDDKKIPIPRLVYKLVRYRSHECRENKELCWFNVIIVIQNNPDPDAEKLCLKDKCQEWGFDYVQISDLHNREEVDVFVYCCRLTKEIANLIKFDVGKTQWEDLNLNHFPRFNGINLEYDRIQTNFEKQYIDLKKEIRG